MSYTKLIELLGKPSTSSLDGDETKAVEKANEFFGSLDDHVLVEVTRFAVANCAFRLAVNDEVSIEPTTEVFRQALIDTLKLMTKSVEDDDEF